MLVALCFCLRDGQVGKSLLQRLDHFRPAIVLLVPCLELVSFCGTGVTTHGADIDHAVSELDECSSHGWETFQFRNVS